MVEETVMDVSTLTGPMMMFVMMATTMLIVTLMEVLAARKIHQMDGMITALFVNVKRMMEEAVGEMVMEVSTPTCLLSLGHYMWPCLPM